MTDRPTPPLFLVGPRLGLRPLSERDLDGPYMRWFNDERVCRGNSHHVFPYTLASAREYVASAQSTRDQLVLAVVLHDGDRHIGNIALQGIAWYHRSAEFAIMIGEVDAWGHGYSKEASRLLIAHAFHSLNLHRVGCATLEPNVAMNKLALSLGMREEGRRRQAAFKGGRYVDIIEYGILAPEFQPPHDPPPASAAGR